MRASVTPAAVSSIVALQIGVGSDAFPDGNVMSIETVVPETVPVNVPTLFMWQDEQVPSLGSRALVATVPDRLAPFCTMVSDTVCWPSALEPGPLQLPASPTMLGPEGELVHAARISPAAPAMAAIRNLFAIGESIEP